LGNSLAPVLTAHVGSELVAEHPRGGESRPQPHRVVIAGCGHPLPGTPRKHYFEGMAQLGDMSDEERHEWSIKNDNFFIE